jgi:hypothetical protein
MTKLAKVLLATDLLEAIMTARNNDFVNTDCPKDLRVVKVVQSADDQANHQVVLVVQSEEADWPDIKFNGPEVDIPFVGPFQYTVVDPDEDESPPVTEEIAP